MMSEQPAQEEARPKPPDASAGRLQVLATEHWSLLATRSLTYMESFSRVTMFLAVLSGAVVALALLAQADQFHTTFLASAILILAVVAFVGLVTIARIGALNRENFVWVQGMNRLRHAYLEMYPDLAPYFVSASHDDFRGVMVTMALPLAKDLSPMARASEGFQSLPAMVSMIVTVIAGLWAALVAFLFGASTIISVVVAAVVFLLANVLISFLAQRRYFRYVRGLVANFPSPDEPVPASKTSR